MALREPDRLPLAGVDLDAVRAQWRSLAPPYDVERWVIPLPVWATRPFDQDGPAAWETLRGNLRRADPKGAFCIYVHIPFCSRRCGFCDCYSFRLPPRHEVHKRRYVRRLGEELRLWSEEGSLAARPVSTVHLGGGTPTYLGPELLTELAETCRSLFATSPRTEWALESTVESLTPEMIETMETLGFRRLHIGVQSLEEPVREAIGRRRPVPEVLARIEETLARGWIVSVDMVCGLPHQTISSFARDIRTLIAAGVDGIALYELLIYPQNRRWAERQGLTRRSHAPNYLMFQVAAAILEDAGYRKNTFNHWAGPRDDNRYFTFPTRGEDCLAVGAIADGVFGDYHYRHLPYARYLRAEGSPGLQGGLRRTAEEADLHPVTTAIMAGRVPRDLVPRLRTPDGEPLPGRWAELGLVAPGGDGDLVLLANGSWFAGNMIREVTGRYPERTLQR